MSSYHHNSEEKVDYLDGSNAEPYNEEDDDDNELEDEGEEKDENDDDDDGLLSYLFDKSFLRQHIIAILIAMLATGISYSHILDKSTNYSAYTYKYNPIVTPSSTPEVQSHKSTIMQDNYNESNKVHRKKPLKPTSVHHHHFYRRTNHLIFCPIPFFTPSETNQQRIKRALNTETMSMAVDDETGNNHSSKHINRQSIDPNLQLFQFNFPKKYVHLMKSYFYADDVMDDEYEHYFQQQEKLKSMIKSDDPNFNCLLEAIILNDKKSTVPMHTIGYIQPDIDTFYSNDQKEKHTLNQGLSVLKQGLPDQGKIKLKPADLTYKGFTVKFTNLSPRQIHLYWDSRTKAKFVGIIEPFESFTTATFPGNSFHVTPIYTAEDVLQRWTVTNDESVLFYDPYNEGKDDDGLIKLSFVEREKYHMHQLNRIYASEYLAVTKRPWLALFPRPMKTHFMWEANYFGQTHVVSTKQTHFLLSGNVDYSYEKALWQNLDYEDYDKMLDEKNSGNEDAFVHLPQYREKGELELTIETISVVPRVFEIDNFLSPDEVQHLLALAKVYNVTSEEQKESLNSNHDLIKEVKKKRKKILSSATSNAWIRREYSPIVDSIYQRVADVLQIDESLLRHRNEHEHSELNTHHSIAEALHITQYVDGQGYFPRLDSSQPSVINRYQPNRFATIIFFLNDVGGDMEGGDLVFPLAVTTSNHDGVTVKPKLGKAVVFYNMLPDGNIDDFSHHSSKIIEKGEKWMGTLFVWDPIID